MNKAIFLDRDGTLNIDDGYTHKVEDYELHETVIEGLKKLKDYKLFVISNQSGISRGYFSEKEVNRFNKHMLKDLSNNNIKIEEIYFCPHLPDEGCECRKPNLKFIKNAQKKYHINLEESYVIGDHGSDILLGKNFGGKTIYLLTGHGVKHLKESLLTNPDYIAANFDQAARYITFNNTKLIERSELKKIKKDLEDKKIVTLNGTFDILHKGHEKIIKEAKKQGDILIVALNSDKSVKKNKGPKRPLNSELNRAKMIASYNEVDYVTIFGEETPIPILEILQPDVHVNGSEYGQDCIEAPTIKKYGGKIHVVELLDGHSTTDLIS